ncbi:MAG: hypothetical protein CMJ45_06360 [Planctomyces sp.]|nr:hypothetical protein [Planctomyces sp.]
MRVLLIATNRHHRLMSSMDARPLPIGLAYVAGHLDQDRHSLKVLDLMFSDDYLADVEDTVKEFQPEMVGISIRNLGNHSYIDPQWALPASKEVIDKVRSLSPAKIVVGGPAFNFLPKECFSYMRPDLGIAGDGGETFAELADLLDSNSPYEHLSGLVYRENGAVVFNGVRAKSRFAKPPRFEDLDMEKYTKAGFGIGVLTKLGDFSYPKPDSNGKVKEPDWRVIRPIDEVVSEVKEMEEKYGLRKVFFIDNGFNIPLNHAKSLCHAFLDADLKVNWNTCMAPFSCDAEIVSLMKQAGCALVIMGAIRGDLHDGETLGEKLEPLREVCAMCEEGDLHYTIAQSFGEVGETEQTVADKLAFLRSIKPAMANLRIGSPVLPGSPLVATAIKEGLIADESELIRPTIYVEEEVRDWIVDYMKEEAAKNPRWNLI